MSEQFMRSAALLGDSAMARLQSARVAVFGVGGVGGYVCEALVRSGVGALDVFDKDDVSITNPTGRSSRCTPPSGRTR